MRQPLPKPRKKVRIRSVPSGGKYQLIMLTDYYHDSLPNYPMHFPMLGPFLYDVENDRISVFSYRDLDISQFVQGAAADSRSYDKNRIRKKKRWWGYEYSYSRAVENPVLHNVCYGELHTFDGTWTNYIKLEETVPFADVNFTWYSNLAQLLAMDQSGQLLDHAIVYELGTSNPYDYYNPIYTTDRFVQKVLTPMGIEEFSEWANGTYFNIHYSSNSMLTLQPTIPRILKRSPDGYFRISWHRRLLHAGTCIDERDVEWLATPLAVSPILTSLANYGSESFTGLELLRARLYEQLDSVARVHPKHHQFLACRDAVKGMRTTQINGISFMKELKEIKTLFEPFIEMLVKRKWFSPKAWAGILLSIKYGWKLSIQDWIELIQNLQKIAITHKSIEDYRKFRNSLHTCYGTYNEVIQHPLGYVGSRSNCRVVLRWELPLKRGELDALMGLVSDMGLRLTVVNMWDLIPFSFVVDWFTGIAATFDSIDFKMELDRLRLRERVSSLHNRIATSGLQYYEEFRLIGSLNFDTYTRSVSNEFPKISYERDAPSFGKHTWEMFLLILANSKK